MDIKQSAPLRLTREYTKLRPDLYKVWDEIHTDYVEVDRLARRISNNVVRSTLLAAVIGSTAQWRIAKTIYDFDATLTAELYRQADLSITPDVLHLPYGTIYVRPNFGDLVPFGADNQQVKYDGFFASLDIDRDYGMPVVYFLPLSPRGTAFAPIALGIPEGAETIQGCIDRISDVSPRFGVGKNDMLGMYSSYKIEIAQWVNLLLYLSAVNADVKRDTQHFFRRTKKISDVPKEVDYLHVGASVGYRLRTLRRQVSASPGPGTGRHKSPVMHLRRGHWSTYHVGVGRTRQELKWISPVIVNQDGTPADTTTIFKVK